MEEDSDDDCCDFGVVVLQETDLISDQSSEWRHDGKGEHKEKYRRFVELTFDKKGR